MKLATTDCPLCGPAPSALLFKATDLHARTPGEYDVVGCRSCSLIYVHPIPDREDLARHYATGYWQTIERVHGVASPHLRLMRRLARDYPGGRVLDVGCGAGGKTARMRDMGLQVIGLDPFEEACRLARELHGLEVVRASLQDAPLADGSLDGITLFDVLEHVTDPVGEMRKAYALLRPGGALCVKVPNITSLQARLFGRWWAVLDVPRHLHHFSPRSLRHALVLAGFGRVQCSVPPDPDAAYAFELSTLLWLRGRQRPKEAAPADTAGDHPDGSPAPEQVYPAVPPLGKRVFRWTARHVLYAPVAIENLIGRSATLLAVARK